jgi:hypothetical protein
LIVHHQMEITPARVMVFTGGQHSGQVSCVAVSANSN